jgi:succinate dehydrogenase/fumarate reductase flavoprotein subunit
MNESVHTIGATSIRVCSVNTLIVGSGAAGLRAASALHALGQHDIAIVTDGWGQGTSAHAGSDKQTYYKVSLSGHAADSARSMAEDLFAGHCMHGDIALAEAQHSAQAFYHLVELGVPFPHDTYGGFPGYRTDHDPRGRGTSIGPLTSNLMVAALGREVRERNIPVFDRHQIVALLVDRRSAEPRIVGAVGLDMADRSSVDPAFVLFNARAVVFATGGPGGMYAESVYPSEQIGSIGLALAAGATAQNLTESQFGLASIGFRWNLSGSYQQAIPRYVSTDAGGGDEREFLNDVFPDMATLGTAVFKKGYQWPFDPRRIREFGSSLIDLLVYRERSERGRRVFLDYTRNPDGGSRLGPFVLDHLHAEALDYLRKSHATGATPIARLRQLNPPAIDLYREHGIDLTRDRLEIGVCAQHNNGGLKGNHWWESNIRGLFPVGEVNGSHGVYRPGGASLNAGQVGALRAAMFIAKRYGEAPPPVEHCLAACDDQVRAMLAFVHHALDADPGAEPGAAPSPADVRAAIQTRMTRAGAHIRRAHDVTEACREAWTTCEAVVENAAAANVGELGDVFHNIEMSIAHAAYLQSIDEYLARGGQSRGSYLVVDADGEQACAALGDAWRFNLNEADAFVDQHVLEITVDGGWQVHTAWTPVRSIPDTESWFETVWRDYRDDKIIR